MSLRHRCRIPISILILYFFDVVILVLATLSPGLESSSRSAPLRCVSVFFAFVRFSTPSFSIPSFCRIRIALYHSLQVPLMTVIFNSGKVVPLSRQDTQCWKKSLKQNVRAVVNSCRRTPAKIRRSTLTSVRKEILMSCFQFFIVLYKTSLLRGLQQRVSSASADPVAFRGSVNTGRSLLRFHQVYSTRGDQVQIPRIDMEERCDSPGARYHTGVGRKKKLMMTMFPCRDSRHTENKCWCSK